MRGGDHLVVVVELLACFGSEQAACHTGSLRGSADGTGVVMVGSAGDSCAHTHTLHLDHRVAGMHGGRAALVAAGCSSAAGTLRAAAAESQQGHLCCPWCAAAAWRSSCEAWLEAADPPLPPLPLHLHVAAVRLG
jgi:hypothetical protein